MGADLSIESWLGVVFMLCSWEMKMNSFRLLLQKKRSCQMETLCYVAVMSLKNALCSHVLVEVSRFTALPKA